MSGRLDGDARVSTRTRANPLMTTSPARGGREDELAPSTRFELLVELRFASHELMRAGTAFIVAGSRPAGHACVVDSTTLDGLVARLEEGAVSVELGMLFLEAARTIIERRQHELEATR